MRARLIRSLRRVRRETVFWSSADEGEDSDQLGRVPTSSYKFILTKIHFKCGQFSQFC